MEKNKVVEYPQGPVLRSLLFLIYINGQRCGINSLCKVFADDTSFFSKVYEWKVIKNH